MLVFLASAIWAPALGQDTGEVTVWGKLDGAPVDVRVVVRSGDGVVGIFYTPAAVPGIARLSLPAGAYTLVVEHGSGFARGAVVREVTLAAGGKVEVNAEFALGFSASED